MYYFPRTIIENYHKLSDFSLNVLSQSYRGQKSEIKVLVELCSLRSLFGRTPLPFPSFWYLQVFFFFFFSLVMRAFFCFFGHPMELGIPWPGIRSEPWLQQAWCFNSPYLARDWICVLALQRQRHHWSCYTLRTFFF